MEPLEQKPKLKGLPTVLESMDLMMEHVPGTIELDPYVHLMIPENWKQTGAGIHAEWELPSSTILDGVPIRVGDVLEASWLRVYNIEGVKGLLFRVIYPGPREMGKPYIYEFCALKPSHMVSQLSMAKVLAHLLQQTVAKLVKKYIGLVIPEDFELDRCSKCTREAVWTIQTQIGEYQQWCHKHWTELIGGDYKKLMGGKALNYPFSGPVTFHTSKVVVIRKAKLLIWAGLYNERQKNRQLDLLED